MDRTGIAQESGALLRGHFLLSSGKHSDGYVQCQVADGSQGGRGRGGHRRETSKGECVPDMVCYLPWVARHRLRAGAQLVFRLFTERENEEMTCVVIRSRIGPEDFDRRNTWLPRENLLGGVRACFGKSRCRSIGIACLVNRSEPGAVHLPIYSSTEIHINSYDPDGCPICKTEEPLVKPGSRKKF